MSELSGTKELIFDVFVEMTSALGYENVSMRDIARKVGINPASMYYHFESKSKILECVYDYYSVYIYENRTPVDVMKKLIETASIKEIMRALLYTFVTEDQKKYMRMILITKTIYMRLFQDPIANRLFHEVNKNNADYVVNILQHGIDMGYIDSSFDTETFAHVLIGSMIILAVKSFSSPDYVLEQLEQESRILALHERLLASAMNR
jgi:AcrR family transcriptional regulator